MRVHYLLCIFFCLPLSVFSQVDTVFYTSAHVNCAREDARYAEVMYQLNNSSYLEHTYTIPDGRLYRTRQMSSLEPPVYDGPSVVYHQNGDTSKGVYKDNAYTGEVREYYEPEMKLWCSYQVKDGKLHGSLISYYRNGKVKRRARYTKDNLMQSIQYDEQGNEVKYTEFNVMPEPMFNVKKHLSKEMRYPPQALKEGIEGTVNVQFMIDEQGRMQEVTIPEPVHPLLDAEATRVVNTMKLWKPGSKDDMPVKMYFTLPVYFEL
jgi:TonB family protein